MKWEGESTTGAVAEFRMDVADELEIKVEAADAEEVAEAPRLLCARLAAVRVSPEPAAVNRPRGPGRPKGSKSRPRVEPEFDTSAPPERDEARKARAKWALRK